MEQNRKIICPPIRICDDASLSEIEVSFIPNYKIEEIEVQILQKESKLAVNQIEIDKLSADIDDFDKWFSICSGFITGIIDSVFVGEFSLDEGTKWGKEKVDKFVIEKAKKKGYKGKNGKFTLSGAVSYLEDNFHIAADELTDKFGGGNFHHFRDFSHHMSLIGLLFSLFTQFTSRVYGTDKLGKFVSYEVSSPELIGKDLPTKLSLGVIHWFFHIVSDMAGSSSSISKGKYGTGVPGSIVSFIKAISALPIFSHKENDNKFCLWISKLFNGTLLMQRDENGKPIKDSVIKFDLRTEIGVAQQIGKQVLPVLINECFVRGFYFVRRLVSEFKKKINSLSSFINDIDWYKTLPFSNRSVKRMLVISSGTFVAIDMADSAIRGAVKSGGNWAAFGAQFALRLNYVGIGRFTIACYSDVKMGWQCSKKREDRMQLYQKLIGLYNAKLFYKEADMWVEAKNVAIAIHEMEYMAMSAITYYFESLEDIGERLQSISAIQKECENSNSTLLDNISILSRL